MTQCKAHISPHIAKVQPRSSLSTKTIWTRPHKLGQSQRTIASQIPYIQRPYVVSQHVCHQTSVNSSIPSLSPCDYATDLNQPRHDLHIPFIAQHKPSCFTLPLPSTNSVRGLLLTTHARLEQPHSLPREISYSQPVSLICRRHCIYTFKRQTVELGDRADWCDPTGAGRPSLPHFQPWIGPPIIYMSWGQLRWRQDRFQRAATRCEYNYGIRFGCPSVGITAKRKYNLLIRFVKVGINNVVLVVQLKSANDWLISPNPWSRRFNISVAICQGNPLKVDTCERFKYNHFMLLLRTNKKL